MIVLRARRRQKATAAALRRVRAYSAASASLTKTKSTAPTSARNPVATRSDGFQPKSHDVVDAARAQPFDDARPARAVARGEGEVDVPRALARDRRRQPRLQPIVDAVEGDEAAIARRRQRHRDRVRFRRPLQVDDADACRAAGARAASRAEGADDRRSAARDATRRSAVMTAPPPIVDTNRCGPQLLAAARHVRQADEDQILEGFADGEQIDARHARKV